ncbi:MAG: hypothetical protein HY696_09345 [Deltaproteobacteria bacterium]|nr:hypothetical protein [Deltaproteobacteria bacterium]
MSRRICTSRGAALTELLWVTTLLGIVVYTYATVAHRGLQAFGRVVGWVAEGG